MYVKGLVVGFFILELFYGIGLVGFYVYFVNDDCNFGGYVLDFEVEDVKVEI